MIFTPTGNWRNRSDWRTKKSYVYALINSKDQWHSRAIDWQRKITPQKRQFIVSEFILTEIGDGLSSLAFRKAASRSIRLLQADRHTEIVPVSSGLFEQALELFENRDDDCTSFVIMREYEVSDALTTDEHFQQAGFNALLLG